MVCFYFKNVMRNYVDLKINIKCYEKILWSVIAFSYLINS